MALHNRPSGRSLTTGDAWTHIEELSQNLWWSWNPEALALFRRTDEAVFTASNNNPVATLRHLPARRKRELLRDAALASRIQSVRTRMRRYLAAPTWYDSVYSRQSRGMLAYFCMEYAFHESLPLYAGGLGILAGDHLKSASDLGIPLIAIGIFWRHGYTQQRIDGRGTQQDEFPVLAPRDTPFREVIATSGRPLRIRIPMGNDSVIVRTWRADVGRIPLFLLDTDLPDNPRRHREIVHRLYCGDRDMRIRQEVLLGIGGWRVLRAMRIPVAACHLNEGHAAFLSIERIAERMEQKKASFALAMRFVRDTSIFTTHTPVPDGNEVFDPALVDRYFGDQMRRLGLTREQFHDLARVTPGNRRERFGLTPLALRTSRYANGVAALHGQVARRMWQPLYPGRGITNVPIGHVTNGIHLRTWLHPQMAKVLDEALSPPRGRKATAGESWDDRQDSQSTWKRIASIPEEHLWDVHEQLKSELISFCRKRLDIQLRRDPVRGMSVRDIAGILDPHALTIGFARRFAPYKRATLLFSDPDRLARLLNDRAMPVQIIFAGKAHPDDESCKLLVATVVRFAREPRFRRRVVVLENYDMQVARHLVAGCDIWLNNPRRPQEASGTSGMKPALHGGLNLSILDGWWPEGYNHRNGWAIGRPLDHDGTLARDRRDARDLYYLLEREVVPLYYRRDRSGLPSRWIARMKNAMTTIPPFFNTHRQVKQYLTRYYLPAIGNSQRQE